MTLHYHINKSVLVHIGPPYSCRTRARFNCNKKDYFVLISNCFSKSLNIEVQVTYQSQDKNNYRSIAN